VLGWAQEEQPRGRRKPVTRVFSQQFRCNICLSRREAPVSSMSKAVCAVYYVVKQARYICVVAAYLWCCAKCNAVSERNRWCLTGGV